MRWCRSRTARQPAGVVSPAKGWAALLVLWCCAGLAVALYLDPGPVRVLLPALLALVAAAGLWRGLPHVGPAAAVLALAVYGLFLVLKTDTTVAGPRVSLAVGPTTLAAILPPLVVAAFVLIGAGLLADALAESAERDELARRRDQRILADLTPTIDESGVLKPGHANREIGEEVVRARRYGYPLCLAIVGLDGWEPAQFGQEDMERQFIQLAAAVKKALRPVDVVAVERPGRLLVLLPHTDLDGAHIAIDKVRHVVRDEANREARAGVAEFPMDAADAVGLLTEATIALDFATTTEIGIASRALLSDDVLPRARH